jgi:hypothetical protein
MWLFGGSITSFEILREHGGSDKTPAQCFSAVLPQASPALSSSAEL